jgi:hypothetical protein
LSWVQNVYSFNQSIKVCRSLLSKSIKIPITKNNTQAFDKKCVDVLAHTDVNQSLNQRLYRLTESDFIEIELRLRKSNNLKKDLEHLVDKNYFHQRENLSLFFRRLRKSRSIASESN